MKKLIVTHHSPDLDAITSVWLLQRFDAQHYAGTRVAFVNPGETISEAQAAKYEATPAEITHVDTGLGEFDHHDSVRGQDRTVCAATLILDYLITVHPEIAENKTLRAMVNHVLDVDNFGEVFWPEASNTRYQFMLLHIIDGMNLTQSEDDSYQVDFGGKCLDFVYASMESFLKSQAKIEAKGLPFPVKGGRALAIETRNNEVVPTAQKEGYVLVVHKNSQSGHIRIKARPDADFDLRGVYEKIVAIDKIGYWFYHPSGKMALNGSQKVQGRPASPLTLNEVIEIIKEELGA